MRSLKELIPLFVLEMANNHMGSLEHGLCIVKEFGALCATVPYKMAFKLQYRHLDTFIHPDYKDRMDVKYVKRFSETRLSTDEMKSLKDEIVRQGFLAMCTPFDEKSVDLIEEHQFDIIKIASCSFTDWPLLERIAKNDKPIIASTAGVPLDDIDKVVSFFEHRNKDFALMHCVAEYPTTPTNLQLNQISLLRERYPQVTVGYSTHESPDVYDAVKVAVGKGAKIFEKHVGIPTTAWPLNNYSSNLEQTKIWLAATREAFSMCGVEDKRADFKKEEIESLMSLHRGVFVKRPFAKGEKILEKDVFFAIPTINGQLTANDMSKYTELTATEDIPINSPVLSTLVSPQDHRQKIYNAVQNVKSLLQKSGVAVPPKVDLEISHHYGIDRFPEFGLTMLTVVNREYCKKLIILLPGQKHPEQFHRQKEETFHVLYGDVYLNLDGDNRTCSAGEVIVVERGEKHTFGSTHGAIIEEISSTHYVDDSFYTDPTVMQNSNRKTFLTYWLS
jgi:sialic acid synthase SpsE/quercetin dioxygenase-like cupin family protein